MSGHEFYELTRPQKLFVAIFNYAYKFIIAVAITPLIYLAHWIMDKYLGHQTAVALIQEAAVESG